MRAAPPMDHAEPRSIPRRAAKVLVDFPLHPFEFLNRGHQRISMQLLPVANRYYRLSPAVSARSFLAFSNQLTDILACCAQYRGLASPGLPALGVGSAPPPHSGLYPVELRLN